jgi:hypothetical protein
MLLYCAFLHGLLRMFSFLTKDHDKAVAEQLAHTAWIKQQHKDVVAPARKKIHEALDQITKSMFDDLWSFKLLLQRASFYYQSINRNKFFKRAGRERAKKFSNYLDKSFTCEDILTALKKTLARGNYDNDSFKTILHQKIVESYPAHRDVLSKEALDEAWIALDKFFKLLDIKLRAIDKHVPGLIL